MRYWTLFIARIVGPENLFEEVAFLCEIVYTFYIARLFFILKQQNTYTA